MSLSVNLIKSINSDNNNDSNNNIISRESTTRTLIDLSLSYSPRESPNKYNSSISSFEN